MPLAEGVSARITIKPYATGNITPGDRSRSRNRSGAERRADPAPGVVHADGQQGHLPERGDQLAPAARRLPPRCAPRQRRHHRRAVAADLRDAVRGGVPRHLGHHRGVEDATPSSPASRPTTRLDADRRRRRSGRRGLPGRRRHPADRRSRGRQQRRQLHHHRVLRRIEPHHPRLSGADHHGGRHRVHAWPAPAAR